MLFLTHVTVPVDRFGDIDPDTCFVRQRDLLVRGGALPYPCVLRKKNGNQWERAFPSDHMTHNTPLTGTLDPNEHVIVLH